MVDGSCSNRAESSPLNTKSMSLVLVNYFATNPNLTLVCMENSAPLPKMMNTCYEAAGKRWPNFIAVDFYKVFYPLKLQFSSTWVKCLWMMQFKTQNQFEDYFVTFYWIANCRRVMVEALQKLSIRLMAILLVDVTILIIARFVNCIIS